MIAIPPGLRVWLAGGVTETQCGMNGPFRQVQEVPGRDPHPKPLWSPFIFVATVQRRSDPAERRLS